MTISDELIRYLESLARIEPTDEQRAACGNDLQRILSYMDTLNELDTSNVSPLSHAFDVSNVMREDEIQNGDNREAILANAPHELDGCFKVPKTVD